MHMSLPLAAFLACLAVVCTFSAQPFVDAASAATSSSSSSSSSSASTSTSASESPSSCSTPGVRFSPGAMYVWSVSTWHGSPTDPNIRAVSKQSFVGGDLRVHVPAKPVEETDGDEETQFGAADDEFLYQAEPPTHFLLSFEATNLPSSQDQAELVDLFDRARGITATVSLPSGAVSFPDGVASDVQALLASFVHLLNWPDLDFQSDPNHSHTSGHGLDEAGHRNAQCVLDSIVRHPSSNTALDAGEHAAPFVSVPAQYTLSSPAEARLSDAGSAFPNSCVVPDEFRHSGCFNAAEEGEDSEPFHVLPTTTVTRTFTQDFKHLKTPVHLETGDFDGGKHAPGQAGGFKVPETYDVQRSSTAFATISSRGTLESLVATDQVMVSFPLAQDTFAAGADITMDEVFTQGKQTTTSYMSLCLREFHAAPDVEACGANISSEDDLMSLEDLIDTLPLGDSARRNRDGTLAPVPTPLSESEAAARRAAAEKQMRDFYRVHDPLHGDNSVFWEHDNPAFDPFPLTFHTHEYGTMKHGDKVVHFNATGYPRKHPHLEDGTPYSFLTMSESRSRSKSLNAESIRAMSVSEVATIVLDQLRIVSKFLNRAPEGTMLLTSFDDLSDDVASRLLSFKEHGKRSEFDMTTTATLVASRYIPMTGRIAKFHAYIQEGKDAMQALDTDELYKKLDTAAQKTLSKETVKHSGKNKEDSTASVSASVSTDPGGKLVELVKPLLTLGDELLEASKESATALGEARRLLRPDDTVPKTAGQLVLREDIDGVDCKQKDFPSDPAHCWIMQHLGTEFFKHVTNSGDKLGMAAKEVENARKAVLALKEAVHKVKFAGKTFTDGLMSALEDMDLLSVGFSGSLGKPTIAKVTLSANAGLHVEADLNEAEKSEFTVTAEAGLDFTSRSISARVIGVEYDQTFVPNQFADTTIDLPDLYLFGIKIPITNDIKELLTGMAISLGLKVGKALLNAASEELTKHLVKESLSRVNAKGRTIGSFLKATKTLSLEETKKALGMALLSKMGKGPAPEAPKRKNLLEAISEPIPPVLKGLSDAIQSAAQSDGKACKTAAKVPAAKLVELGSILEGAVRCLGLSVQAASLAKDEGASLSAPGGTFMTRLTKCAKEMALKSSSEPTEDDKLAMFGEPTHDPCKAPLAAFKEVATAVVFPALNAIDAVFNAMQPHLAGLDSCKSTKSVLPTSTPGEAITAAKRLVRTSVIASALLARLGEFSNDRLECLTLDFWIITQSAPVSFLKNVSAEFEEFHHNVKLDPEYLAVPESLYDLSEAFHIGSKNKSAKHNTLLTGLFPTMEEHLAAKAQSSSPSFKSVHHLDTSRFRATARTRLRAGSSSHTASRSHDSHSHSHSHSYSHSHSHSHSRSHTASSSRSHSSSVVHSDVGHGRHRHPRFSYSTPSSSMRDLAEAGDLESQTRILHVLRTDPDAVHSLRHSSKLRFSGAGHAIDSSRSHRRHTNRLLRAPATRRSSLRQASLSPGTSLLQVDGSLSKGRLASTAKFWWLFKSDKKKEEPTVETTGTTSSASTSSTTSTPKSNVGVVPSEDIVEVEKNSMAAAADVTGVLSKVLESSTDFVTCVRTVSKESIGAFHSIVEILVENGLSGDSAEDISDTIDDFSGALEGDECLAYLTVVTRQRFPSMATFTRLVLPMVKVVGSIVSTSNHIRAGFMEGSGDWFDRDKRDDFIEEAETRSTELANRLGVLAQELSLSSAKSSGAGKVVHAAVTTAETLVKGLASAFGILIKFTSAKSDGEVADGLSADQLKKQVVDALYIRCVNHVKPTGIYRRMVYQSSETELVKAYIGPVVVMGVPLIFTIRVLGDIGIDMETGTCPYAASHRAMSITPAVRAAIKTQFRVGIGIPLISAGVYGTLTVIELSLPVQLDMVPSTPESGGYAMCVRADPIVGTLGGSLGIYFELPVIGDREFELTKWRPITKRFRGLCHDFGPGKKQYSCCLGQFPKPAAVKGHAAGLILRPRIEDQCFLCGINYDGLDSIDCRMPPIRAAALRGVTQMHDGLEDMLDSIGYCDTFGGRLGEVVIGYICGETLTFPENGPAVYHGYMNVWRVIKNKPSKDWIEFTLADDGKKKWDAKLLPSPPDTSVFQKSLKKLYSIGMAGFASSSKDITADNHLLLTNPVNYVKLVAPTIVPILTTPPVELNNGVLHNLKPNQDYAALSTLPVDRDGQPHTGTCVLCHWVGKTDLSCPLTHRRRALAEKYSLSIDVMVFGLGRLIAPQSAVLLHDLVVQTLPKDKKKAAKVSTKGLSIKTAAVYVCNEYVLKSGDLSYLHGDMVMFGQASPPTSSMEALFKGFKVAATMKQAKVKTAIGGFIRVYTHPDTLFDQYVATNMGAADFDRLQTPCVFPPSMSESHRVPFSKSFPNDQEMFKEMKFHTTSVCFQCTGGSNFDCTDRDFGRSAREMTERLSREQGMNLKIPKPHSLWDMMNALNRVAHAAARHAPKFTKRDKGENAKSVFNAATSAGVWYVCDEHAFSLKDGTKKLYGVVLCWQPDKYWLHNYCVRAVTSWDFVNEALKNDAAPKVKASDFKYSIVQPESKQAPLEDQMLHTLVAATSDYLRDKSLYPTCPIGDPDED